MSNLVTKPKPEDFKCRQLPNNEVEWNHGDESEAIKYFIAEEYYQRMRIEFAIHALESIDKALTVGGTAAAVLRINEALVALGDN